VLRPAVDQLYGGQAGRAARHGAGRRPGTGRLGGILWLILVPCLLLFAAEEFTPALPAAADAGPRWGYAGTTCGADRLDSSGRQKNVLGADLPSGDTVGEADELAIT